jgi:hypothetical protein
MDLDSLVVNVFLLLEKFMKFLFTGLACLLILLIARCSKEGNTVVKPADPGEIKVKLNLSYIPSAKIDSAVLIWETFGQMQRLYAGNLGDTLQFDASALKGSTGVLTIQLYTQVKKDGMKLQFEKRWTTGLGSAASAPVAGPAGFYDPEWMPRVILEENGWTETMIIIALRPGDPYFAIRHIPPRWPQLGIARSYYQKAGGRLITEKIWRADGTGKTEIEDRSFFAGLQRQLEGKDWGWIELTADVFNPNDIIAGFSLSYNGPR